MTYVGPRRRVRPEDLFDIQNRGWVLQPKADGCYVRVAVGGVWRARAPKRGPALRLAGGLDHRHAHNQRLHGVVAGAVYRSGRSALGSLGPLYGLDVGAPDGSVLVGELMAMTPASLRWCQSRGVGSGLVLFDCLRWGGADVSGEPYMRRQYWLQVAQRSWDEWTSAHVEVAPVWRDRFASRYEEIVGTGGEGVVAKDPGARAGARSSSVKVKREDHCTVRVVELLPGEGCMRVDWGGIGFAMSLPKWTVAPGQLIDVKAIGHYDSGVPRHAVAVRPRADLT